jgi:hypothetical protein
MNRYANGYIHHFQYTSDDVLRGHKAATLIFAELVLQ